jgi:hypothetical protein
LNSGKLTLAAMYFGRVLVIGCGLEAALAHVSTILCRLRLRQKNSAKASDVWLRAWGDGAFLNYVSA